MMAMLAPLLLFWNQCKSFVVRTIAILWKDREIDRMLAPDYYKYLNDHCKKYEVDDYRIQDCRLYNTTTGEWDRVLVRFPKHVFFFYRWVFPVSVTSSGDSLRIRYLKFTFPYEKILTAIHTQRIVEERSSKSSSQHSKIIKIYSNRRPS